MAPGIEHRRNRYVLHPGFVRSKNDGQRHYIGAQDLARLYKVPVGAILVVVRPNNGFQAQKGDIHLHPKADGDYSMPKAEQI